MHGQISAIGQITVTQHQHFTDHTTGHRTDDKYQHIHSNTFSVQNSLSRSVSSYKLRQSESRWLIKDRK